MYQISSMEVEALWKVDEIKKVDNCSKLFNSPLNQIADYES